jgi:N-acetylneuraminic acid mutarotase
MVWDGTKVVMFGGNNDLETYYNDIWWYYPMTNTWVQQFPTISPTARSGHSMVWDGARVIMFGGNDSDNYYNDLWWYYPGTNTWAQQTVRDSFPEVRTGHSMVWDGTRVVMFGGNNGSTYYNDLWMYYPWNNGWFFQDTMIGEPPDKRTGHQIVWDGASVILFGGGDGNVVKNDLWWYRP